MTSSATVPDSPSARKIALYGGAFDPPHNGHVATVSLLLNSRLVDEVWMTPSGDRPDKPLLTRASHRLAMTKTAIDKAFENDSRVKVYDAHATNKAGFATIHLLDYLKTQKLNHNYSIIIGSELLHDLPTWNESSRLQKQASFLVVERPGTGGSVAPEGFSCVFVENQFKAGVTISSSTIRKMLREKKACAGFVPREVLQYCQNCSLYI